MTEPHTMPRTKKTTTASNTPKTIPTVPESEWPYPVPENWRWVRLCNVAQWGSGGTPSRKNPDYYSGDIPWVKTGELNDDYILSTEEKITKEAVKRSSAKLFPINTIIIAMYGATIGKTAILGIEATTNQACACGVCNPNGLYYKYLFYYARSKKTWFIELGKGGAQPNISQDIIKKTPIPLPPLAEQQRIVDRIERLFAKLDEAREKAQAVVDGFENRKAAILHKAFTGELTRKWREERGIGMESWKTVALEDVCYSIFDGDHMPPPKSEQGIPFLVISNINDGYLSYDNSRFVPLEYYESLSDTRKPKIGDLLYTLVGSYGIPVVVDNNRPFCFQRHMALLKPRNIDTYFLWYQMQTNETYDQATNIATGTAQLTVPIKGLRKMKILSPIHNEQLEIVHILDEILLKLRQSRDLAESVIAQIDGMKKAILARAFRGELGTNDPSESACEE